MSIFYNRENLLKHFETLTVPQHAIVVYHGEAIVLVPATRALTKAQRSKSLGVFSRTDRLRQALHEMDVPKEVEINWKSGSRKSQYLTDLIEAQKKRRKYILDLITETPKITRKEIIRKAKSQIDVKNEQCVDHDIRALKIRNKLAGKSGDWIVLKQNNTIR